MLTVRHSTIYRYRRPVVLAPHRLMLRPHDSHDLRLVDTGLVISPPPQLHWYHDVFGNSVAIATFSECASELRIDSVLRIEQFAGRQPKSQIDWAAARYPFSYSDADRIDLGPLLIPHYPDPDGRLAAWAQAFVLGNGTATLALLSDINAAIQSQFGYQLREEEGTQSPLHTLDRGWGTCRDFAVLLVDAARSLGFGARIVTGYLDDPLDYDKGINGAGATHAWADIYLPGVGWLAFDPTNGTVGEHGLIRVAVAREISQAVPISGSYIGVPNDYIGMTVKVTVMPEDGV